MSEAELVKRERWYIPASNGEGDLVSHVWLSANPLTSQPRALVQIAHGMSEHAARYDEFARYVCARGFAVVANDHAGHGLSAQEHLGSFSTEAGGFDCAVEDLHRLFLHAEVQLGTLPRFLLGHSMGSILSGLYAERYSGLAALILSGTPSNIPASRLLQLLSGLIAKVRGQTARSPLLERLTGSADKLSLEEAMQARTWLTRDTEKVREFCLDPLCGFDYSAGGYYTLLRGYHTLNADTWSLHIPDIPMLVIGGTDDTASDKGRGPVRYTAQLRSTGHTQVELELFEGCRHELLNEINRDDIYEYLCTWLIEKLPT